MQAAGPPGGLCLAVLGRARARLGAAAQAAAMARCPGTVASGLLGPHPAPSSSAAVLVPTPASVGCRGG